MTLYRPARRPGWWQEVPADEQEGGLDETELVRTARLGLTTNGEMAEMREMHRSGDGNHCSTRNKLRHIMLRHIMAPTHGEQDRAEPRDEGAMHASELAEEERQERLMKRPMKRPMTASELAEEERPMKEERARAPRVRFDPRCGPPPLARVTPTETEALILPVLLVVLR